MSKRIKKAIYVLLKGRIGNQFFMYAFARALQAHLGDDDAEIIIDDSEVLRMGWEDSLVHYGLRNVRFVHNRSEAKSRRWRFRYVLLRIATRICGHDAPFSKKYARELVLRPFLSLFGIFMCENGFMHFEFGRKYRYLLCGYFQSEKYFAPVKDELVSCVRLHDDFDYPGLDLLRSAESVCVSIKVEHNIGSSMYAVCGKEYWQAAIRYVLGKIRNPLFFICSDDVDYVRENLIDCSQVSAVFQDRSQPIHKTLAAMSCCKHFIIGNSTFSWWAQYASKNPGKITVAPSRWMLVDMPIDIYQDGWHLIDVEKSRESDQ